MQPLNLVIIEDERIVAADLAARLGRAGYRITAIVDTGEEAIARFAEWKPDLVMVDIRLGGKLDGIQTVAKINEMANTPVIYLTAFSDQATWERAKATAPAAYLTKPFRERDIHSAIELAILARGSRGKPEAYGQGRGDQVYGLEDRCFIRTANSRFEKLHYADLLYLEAERSYCHVVTRGRRLLLSESLNQLHGKMDHPHIIRIHRSYAVNLQAIDCVEQRTVIVAGNILPIGDSYLAHVLNRMNFIQ